MTLDEIFKIIDQIKPNEEFYNPETNKVLILNKKGGLTFSDGSNPFSIENKDLKFIKRERKIVKGQEKDSWDDVYDYLNSDKANFVSIDELEKNYTYDNAIPNKELLEKLGIKVKLDGVGYVESQSIPEKTEIKKGMEMTLKLKPKFKVS